MIDFMAALSLPAFPIDGPVLPGSRQIGRGDAIEELTRRVVDQASHQWLIGPRRIGKTSLAKAAADRVRDAGHIAIEIDLSRSSVHSSAALAAELAHQARSAGVGSGAVETGRRIGRRARRMAGPAIEMLGESGTDLPVGGIAALLGAVEEPTADLETVVSWLAIESGSAQRRIMVLLDEVHLLREIGGERAVADGIRSGQGGLVFVFAGSEESVVEELRRDGPLAKVGQSFAMPEISTQDWMSGLAARFDEIGLRVPEQLVMAIVDAGDSQPRNTMLICSFVQSLAREAGMADEVVVGEAIRQARRDGSWT